MAIDFVLGAIDPEMFTIARALTDAGIPWRWARGPVVGGETYACPDDGVSGVVIGERGSGAEHDVLVRRRDDRDWWYASATLRAVTPHRAPAAAYASQDVPAADGVTRVWVECRPGHLSRAEMEARGDVVIDHHDVRFDPMASAPPADAYAASSIGQVGEWLLRRAIAAQNEQLAETEYASLFAAAEALRTPAARVAGALDHCLFAALGGLVPGVDRDAALRAAAEMAADRDLAALKGTPPEAGTPAAYLAQVEAAQVALRAAPKLTLAEQEVCDLLSHRGRIGSLPVAAAHAGLAYVIEVPSRPGVPTTCSLGGAAGPEAVTAFAEIARAAFAETYARALDAGQSYVARTMEECASQGAARGGVYAMPARGMASAYLPAATLAPWLRRHAC